MITLSITEFITLLAVMVLLPPLYAESVTRLEDLRKEDNKDENVSN